MHNIQKSLLSLQISYSEGKGKRILLLIRTFMLAVVRLCLNRDFRTKVNIVKEVICSVITPVYYTRITSRYLHIPIRKVTLATSPELESSCLK